MEQGRATVRQGQKDHNRRAETRLWKGRGEQDPQSSREYSEEES